jgi:hypothetical protein
MRLICRRANPSFSDAELAELNPSFSDAELAELGMYFREVDR